MRVVIVDDERLARHELRGLLSELPEAEIVGEAANADEARAVIGATTPDIVFLDIEMPGSSGFDLLPTLPAPHPRVVFVTAYDAFALRAFAVNAVDYLLKPVLPERLAETWRRLRQVEVEPQGVECADTALLREDDQVFLRGDGRTWFVPVRRLRLLEGDGNHTRVFFDQERPLLPRSLVALEARLPPTLFLRANRAQLVNRLFIAKVEPWFSGCVRATLTDGVAVEFSRRQSQVFRDRLSL